MSNFTIRNRVSIWLCFLVAIIAAVMMQPGFAAHVALMIIGILLVALRWVAHIEGRGDAE